MSCAATTARKTSRQRACSTLRIFTAATSTLYHSQETISIQIKHTLFILVFLNWNALESDWKVWWRVVASVQWRACVGGARGSTTDERRRPVAAGWPASSRYPHKASENFIASSLFPKLISCFVLFCNDTAKCWADFANFALLKKFNNVNDLVWWWFFLQTIRYHIFHIYVCSWKIFIILIIINCSLIKFTVRL